MAAACALAIFNGSLFLFYVCRGLWAAANIFSQVKTKKRRFCCKKQTLLPYDFLSGHVILIAHPHTLQDTPSNHLRRNSSYDTAFAAYYLLGLYQPWPAGLPVGVCMAHHVPPAGRSLLLRRHPVHDHLAGHHRFQPEQRPAHPGAGHGQGDRPQRGHDRCGAVWFLGLRPVLDALSVGCPLRSGRGQRGCRPEQLRRPALPEPPHELAALYVGRGYHHRPYGDGRGAFRRAELEQRLPVHRPVPDRTDCCAFLQPAPVAQTPRCRPGRHRGQGADPAAGVRAAGRKGSDALLLLLLCTGDHCRALGKQLPDPCAAGARPDGCQLCQPVLYRHYK